MAKYENNFQGDFNEVLQMIEKGILKGSISASYEDGSTFHMGDVHCAVRVYERYSVVGSNRVSLNVTLLASGRDLALSAITSGGSQAMFFKLNTFGEEAFLDCLVKIVREYQRGK